MNGSSILVDQVSGLGLIIGALLPCPQSLASERVTRNVTHTAVKVLHHKIPWGNINQCYYNILSWSWNLYLLIGYSLCVLIICMFLAYTLVRNFLCAYISSLCVYIPLCMIFYVYALPFHVYLLLCIYFSVYNTPPFHVYLSPFVVYPSFVSNPHVSSFNLNSLR